MLRQSALVQRGVSQVESLPAPVGGWNARDSLANMAATDAVTLVNFFPNVSSVDLRGGYQRYATGITGQVQTLMTYAGGATVSLFAISDGGFIYDASAAGAVGVPVVSGLSSGNWEYTNITTAGGSFLYAVNGLDHALIYNGAAWQSVTGVSAPFAITGVDTSTLSNVLLFKHRVWFIQKNTLKAWYLPTDAVAGAAQPFDLSAVATKGGHLVAMGAWTLDAGYGADDNLVFITSEGELIVYRGTDPALAETWAEAGLWQLGAPISRRCFLKWAGDLLVLTNDGLLPLAQALQSSRLDPRVALTNKIQGAINTAINLYGGDHESVGWQIVYAAKQNAVWLNVPVGLGMQQQYVMNTITSSWCQFDGWSANCWGIYNDDPYFGGNGFVGLAWTTTGTAAYADNGANIATQGIQAFNYFGARGVQKYFTRARPAIFSDGVPSVNLGINVDFDTSTALAPTTFVQPSYALWDVALWDGPSVWGQGVVINNPWVGITGIGYCGAIQMRTATMGIQVEWAATDVVYQSGWAGI